MKSGEKAEDRRSFLSSVGAVASMFGFSVPISTLARAQDIVAIDERLHDFNLLASIKDRVTDEILSMKSVMQEQQRAELTSEEKSILHNLALDYGRAFRQFDNKHGIGNDYFSRSPSSIRFQEFRRWIEDNIQAPDELKQERLEQFVKELLSNSSERDGLEGIAYRGMLCGYNEGLCPPQL